MARVARRKIGESKNQILHVAARLFLERGYSDTRMADIAEAADVSYNEVFRVMGDKESILAELVKFVLEGQFAAARMLEGITDDKILFYAAETTLQLHMAESSEHIRELYDVAYSMPKSSEIIQRTITGKLEEIFREHLPHLETKDFYEREIASGGIMRGFMTVPCDMYFTMDRKVKSFLETTFLVYEVPREKINEAVEFVKQFQWEKAAAEAVENMLEVLEKSFATEQVVPEI